MSKLFSEAWQITTVGDRFLMLVLAVAGLSSLFWVEGLAVEGETVLISVEGAPAVRKSLDVSETFTVGGARVVIEHGAIRISESTCPQKLCLHQGPINAVGEMIVCVPNKISIWIEGARKNKFDAVTG